MVNTVSGVGVLDKAVALLDAAARTPSSLADLVAATGVNRATAHRLATALEAHRLLARDAVGRFTAGPRWAAYRLEPVLDPAAAQPVLDALRDRTGESVQLFVRDGDVRVCVAAADRRTGLRDTVAVGAVLPLSAGSGAQVLLAWAAAEPVLLRRARFTAATLATVRRRGWAASRAEREAGVASVSAPVRAADGRVVAALCLSGPADRVGRAPARLAPSVVRAAARLGVASHARG